MKPEKESPTNSILRHKEANPSFFEKNPPSLDIPFVLEGYAKNWPAYTNWHPDFFASNYGDISVETTSCSNGRIKIFTLSDYFKYYIENPVDQHFYYLKNWVFEKDAPALLNDYSIPTFFKCWTEKMPAESRPKLRWLYIGPKGSSSQLHIDIVKSSAWNAVISGKKMWHFYSPDQIASLYNLRIDSFNPDFDKFPRLAEIKPIVCIQNPGDVVFTPSGWPHQVINIESSISITENFINEHNCDDVIDYLEKSNGTKEANFLKNLKNQFINNAPLEPFNS